MLDGERLCKRRAKKNRRRQERQKKNILEELETLCLVIKLIVGAFAMTIVNTTIQIPADMILTIEINTEVYISTFSTGTVCEIFRF